MKAISTLCLVAADAIGSVLLDGAVALPLAITSALCVTAEVLFCPAFVPLPSWRARGATTASHAEGSRRSALWRSVMGWVFGAWRPCWEYFDDKECNSGRAWYNMMPYTHHWSLALLPSVNNIIFKIKSHILLKRVTDILL